MARAHPRELALPVEGVVMDKLLAILVVTAGMAAVGWLVWLAVQRQESGTKKDDR